LIKKMVKLYLAHAFDSRYEIRKWELDFEKQNPIELVNPFYDINRKDIIEIDNGKRQKYEVNENKIVERDIIEIIKSGGLVAIIDNNVVVGTFQEMVYAKLFRKIIFGLITNGHEKHPWLRYHSDFIFTTRKALEDKLIEFYQNN